MAIINIYETKKKYNVIYADPPWSFKTYSQKGKAKKSADAHYRCMDLSDIKQMPIQKLAEDDCVLFMWVTFPMLEQGLELMEAWGFEYKTCAFTWVKRNKLSNSWFWGLGYWTRANAEICLLGTRGHPKRISRSVHSVCDAKIGRHSEKPAEIRDRIVLLCGDVPRIELFARDTCEGWDAFGDELSESK